MRRSDFLFMMGMTTILVFAGCNNIYQENNVRSVGKNSIPKEAYNNEENIVMDNVNDITKVPVNYPKNISPIYTDISEMNSMPYASFTIRQLKDAIMTNNLTFDAYSMDLYEISDVDNLNIDDTIEFGTPDVITVRTIEKNGNNVIINDGIDMGGVELGLNESAMYYRSYGWDDYATYTKRKTLNLPIADNLTLIDDSLMMGKEISRNEILNYLSSDEWLSKMSDEEYFVTQFNGKVLIENGIITQIIKTYIP